MAEGDGWNNHFHRNNAYDTSQIAGTTNNSPPPQQRSSYFRLQEERSDVERGGYQNVNPFASKEDIAPYPTSPFEQEGIRPLPSAPHASDMSSYYGDEGPRNISYGSDPPLDNSAQFPGSYNEKMMENDQELAQQLHNEQFYRPPETNPPTNLSEAPPNGLKALQDPNVRRQLQKQKLWRPWFTWFVTLIQVAVFIVEIIDNQRLTGNLFANFSTNPMLGPSPEVLILTGARYVPCMREVPQLANVSLFTCVGNRPCSLEEYCGLGGFHGGGPNQWYRFIIPIFLHGGVIHIFFNLLVQVQTGGQVERGMGFHRFGVIYMASGIFGFIFGGNFATGRPSLGASGSIFGIIGVLVIDLLQNWKLIIHPCWELTKLLFLVVFTFLLGLLPIIDNFSHIGGFLMGIVTGLILIPTINFSKLHKRFTWFLRISAIPVAILLFVLLTTNFYSGDPSQKCPWCKYLSCLPINGWCDSMGISVTNTTTPDNTSTNT